MEGTQRSQEAGPSSVTIDKTKQQITQKSTHTFHDSNDEDEEEIIDHSKKGVFVPGPLLSLKEQIEKDKVLFFILFSKNFLYFSFCNFFKSF
jgi:Rho GDP-dissociation inhibitor